MGIKTEDAINMLARFGQRGGLSRKPDGGLQAKIASECKDRGWLINQSRSWCKTRSTIGWPDFDILADQGVHLLVECKTAKGKLTPEQTGLILQAKKLGHRIHVVRSIRDWEDVLKLYY